MTLKITDTPIDQIRANDANPRVPLSRQDLEYRQLKSSIQRFGMVRPLIVNERTGLLVGGHQRLQVLRDLGHDTVPVVTVDIDPDAEMALVIALNAIKGRWDESALLAAIQQATAADLDLQSLGFTDREYDELLYSVDAAAAEQIKALRDTQPSDNGDAADDDEEEEKDPATLLPEYASLAYSVRKHERNNIVRGLKLAMSVYEVATPAEALVRIGADLKEGTWPPPVPAAKEDTR